MKKARQIMKSGVAHGQKIEHEEKESIRLNKYISSSGFCSRREADRYIEQGVVQIDGIVAKTGSKVLPGQVVEVNETCIQPQQHMIYLILNKPIGIECTTDTTKPDNIIYFIQHPQRIFPIGRLDKDSSGLIILTNDGDVVNKILRSSNNHEKEYVVTVDKSITTSFLKQLREGVKIYNPVNNSYQTTKPCRVFQENNKTFRIILSEGLNRQIRRMCSAHSYHVQSLKRIRIMNIVVDGLQTGDWRYLTYEEITILNKQLNERK